MKQKKFMLLMALLIVAAVNVGIVLEANRSYDLTMDSIEALSGDETGATITNGEDCHKNGGYWDMALVCAGSGVETVRCEVSGSISLFGSSISGNFKKGKPYTLSWERWSCTTAVGNCCIVSQQGLRVKS